ncbi:hypothetical protein V1505DRAFT_312126 [Lipomyces doorenjongii]
MATSSSTTPSLSSTRGSVSQTTTVSGPASSMLGTARWSSQSLTVSAVVSASASATNSRSILQLSSASALPSRIFVARSSSTTGTAVTTSSIGNTRKASSSSTESAGTSLSHSLSSFMRPTTSTSSPILSSSTLTLTPASTVASASSASLYISTTSTTSFSSSITPFASSTSSAIDTDPVSQLSSRQTTVIASVVGSVGSVLIFAIIFFFFVRRRRRRHSDSHRIFTHSQPRYPPAAAQGASTPRSQMMQTYAQAQTPEPISSTQRSYPPSSSASDLSHPRFLGSLFTRSRRDTGASHLSNSTQGMSSPSAVEQTGFMKISGRKLERWQDPELASIHSISGRIYDRDGREIVRPVAGPSAHDELSHDEEQDLSEGRRSSNESFGEDNGQYYYYVGTPTIPGASSSNRPP